jgi:hypothetical protein
MPGPGRHAELGTDPVLATPFFAAHHRDRFLDLDRRLRVFTATTTASSFVRPWARSSPPPGHEDQRVVDGDAESDLRDEELDMMLTSVNVVSARTSMKVVRMDTAAMSSGSSARNDAYTNSSASSAPAAAINVSIRTLEFSCSPPADSRP